MTHPTSTPTSSADLPFRDPSRSIDERVEDLLGRLTLEEKAGQITQYFYFGAAADALPDDAELTQEQQFFRQQPAMVRQAVRSGTAGSVLFVDDPATVNELQGLAVEETAHGIPLLFAFDVIHGLRTIFPVPIALAASWDPAVAEEAQRHAAAEARAVGIRWVFAPMVDIARDPRWGRMIEGAGEDPVLGAAMAAAQVRGFQGDGDEPVVIAGPKHFVGYGASRGGRDYEDAEISDSELWNVYLPPFKAAVDAGAGNIMSAYMDLNGVPASGNRWLLTDVLRGEFGFGGFVVSDANAVRSLHEQHFAADLTDAAARAVTAGLDMEMAVFDAAYGRLPQAVAGGQVDEAAIDAAARRVLAAKFRLGLFEDPYVDEGRAAQALASPASGDAAQHAAEQTLVLLKNDGLLPLAAERLTSVAVVGQLAASPREQLGPWVFDHDVADTVTVVDGLRKRLGDGVRVEHAHGAGLTERVFPSFFDDMDPTVEKTPADYDDDAEIERAVALARGADVAVVVMGQRQNQIGEAASASSLDLPGRQLEQLQRIVATGTPAVVVVMSGRPLDLVWADEHAPAILQAWYPGTRGGDAIAAALVGDVSPAGRLPFSWPRSIGQLPVIYSHNRSFKPEDQEKRYFDEPSTPLYPFGHGLSYSTFAYANLAADDIAVGETTTVRVDVTNTGARRADEVVQLYIHQRHGTSSRPLRELKAFRRLTLDAGGTATVEFELGPRQLTYWSAATRDWVQDATTLDLYAGGDATAALSTTIEVTGVG